MDESLLQMSNSTQKNGTMGLESIAHKARQSLLLWPTVRGKIAWRKEKYLLS